MNQTFKDYLQVLPYVSGSIILMSIIKAIIFYNVFDIRIVSYLDLSECILIFLDELIFIAIAIIISIVLVYTYFGWDRNEKIIASIQNSEDPKLAYVQTIKALKHQTKFTTLIAVFSLFPFIILQFLNFPMYEASVTSLAFSTLIISILFLPSLLIKIFPLLTTKVAIISLFGILYFGLIINFGLYEAYSYKYGNKSQKMNLTFKSNETINTSDTLVYIGATRNYYFFFNPNTMKKTILMKSELTKLSIQ